MICEICEVCVVCVVCVMRYRMEWRDGQWRVSITMLTLRPLQILASSRQHSDRSGAAPTPSSSHSMLYTPSDKDKIQKQ